VINESSSLKPSPCLPRDKDASSKMIVFLWHSNHDYLPEKNLVELPSIGDDHILRWKVSISVHIHKSPAQFTKGALKKDVE
jgi:hypothetical protein